MKREWNLIRLLLQQLEGTSVDLSEYSEGQVTYHNAQVIEMELAKGNVHFSRRGGSEGPDRAHLSAITPSGHDFLEKARLDTIWARAMAFVRNTGREVSIAALTEILVRMARE